MTPLLLAIQMGHGGCAKLLIEKRKVDIDVNDRFVSVCLHGVSFKNSNTLYSPLINNTIITKGARS